MLQTQGLIPETLMSLKSSLSPTPLSYKSSYDKVEGNKPKPTSKFCQLCHEKFDDYLDVDLLFNFSI